MQKILNRQFPFAFGLIDSFFDFPYIVVHSNHTIFVMCTHCRYLFGIALSAVHPVVNRQGQSKGSYNRPFDKFFGCVDRKIYNRGSVWA